MLLRQQGSMKVLPVLVDLDDKLDKVSLRLLKEADAMRNVIVHTWRVAA